MTIHYNEENATHADKFNLGQYFNQFASKIHKGPLPTRQFVNQGIHTAPSYKHSLLLVAFVADEAEIADSVMALEEQSGRGVADL